MGLSLHAVSSLIRRWWIPLILVPIVTGLIALGYGMTRTPMYASNATLMVSIPSSDSLDAYNANLLAQDLSTTYQNLTTSDPVLQAVATSMTPPATVENLRDHTSVTASSGALFIITFTDPDAGRAAATVNAIASELPKFVSNLSPTDQDGPLGTVTTVAQGEVPAAPYAPRLPAYTALGVIGGALLCNALIFLFERLDNRVRSTSQVQLLPGLEFLGRIPSATRTKMGSATLVLDDPGKLAAGESIRSVRGSILAASANDEPARTLVVASPDMSAGKTMVAANLAMAMARMGKRVLLVDANLRSPRLHTVFGLDNGGGLAWLLNQPEFSWTSAAVEVEPNLAVIPTGVTNEHPADVLNRDTFGSLIDELLAVADIVIVDTPSSAARDDATLVASHKANVVLICRQGKTRIPDLGRANDLFTGAGANVLGVVVTHGKRLPFPFPRIRREPRRQSSFGARASNASRDHVLANRNVTQGSTGGRGADIGATFMQSPSPMAMGFTGDEPHGH